MSRKQFTLFEVFHIEITNTRLIISVNYYSDAPLEVFEELYVEFKSIRMYELLQNVKLSSKLRPVRACEHSWRRVANISVVVLTFRPRSFTFEEQ